MVYAWAFSCEWMERTKEVGHMRRLYAQACLEVMSAELEVLTTQNTICVGRSWWVLVIWARLEAQADKQKTESVLC